MNGFLPKVSSPKDDLDAEMVLDFLAAYHALEGALLRAGFTRPGRRPGTTQPDWGGFARRIADRFDPGASPELIGAVCTLLADPDQPGYFRNRRPEIYLMEPSIPERNTVWLAEVVQEIRNRLLLRMSFADDAWSDGPAVVSAMLVVQAWSKLDPQVESLLTHVQ
jgi:hypothetical protein